jgi:hypothetical protein
MKPRYVRLYLLFTGIVLTLTALAKLPAIFPTPNMCIEYPILGGYQPLGLSNEQLLAIASGAEFAIVGLICFSPLRWLPCLASTLWGSLCLIARMYFMDPDADCGCLGWFAKPGPGTNMIASVIALTLALGGGVALWMIWVHSEQFKRSVIHGKTNWAMIYGILLIVAGTSLCFGLPIVFSTPNFVGYNDNLQIFYHLVIAFPPVAVGLVAILRGIQILRSLQRVSSH